MGWKQVEAKTVRCTKSLAKEFANMQPAPGDRGVKDRLITNIKKKVQAGKFRVASFASCRCKANGVVYRTNGKHTATSLDEMNGDFPDGLMAHVERYEADTLKDVAELYSTFDPRASARSVGDINKSYANGDPTLAELPVMTISMGVASIKLAENGGDQGSRSAPYEERAAEMYKHVKFFEFLNNMNANDRKYRHLKRSSVGAAMFLTFKKDPKAAEEFWLAVRDGSGSDHTAMDRVLHKYLLTTDIRSHTGNKKGRCDSVRAMFFRCIYAWNAWREGRKTDLRYYENSLLPKIV